MNDPNLSKTRQDRENFARGVLLLSIAGIISKICGVLYKIPLTHLLGSGGMGYFGTAYTVYALLYVFSTAGLPSAVSILVSRAGSDETDENGAQDRILYVTLSFFGTLGAALSALTILLAGRIARFFGSDPSAPCIAAIAPSIFFSCVSGALRGYFQGKKRMAPTAVSQSVEATGKFLFGIAACMGALKAGFGIPTAAAFAVFGVTLSSMASAVCLLIAAQRDGFSLQTGRRSRQKRRRDSPDLLTSVLLLSLPITIGAALSGVDGMIDLFAFLRILPRIGYQSAAANALYGVYTSMALPMYNLPTIFASPVSSCLLPLIAASRDREQDEELVRKAVFCTILFALPSTIGLTLFSEPILALLFSAKDVPAGAVFLSLLAPGSLFLCLLGVVNSVLQAKKRVWLPVLAMSLGMAAKLIVIASSVRLLGARSVPLSAAVCAFVSFVGAGVMLRRVCRLRVPYLRVGFMPLLIASSTCFAAFTAQKTLPQGAAVTLLLIAVTALAYFLLLMLSGTLRRSGLSTLITINRKRRKQNNENRQISESQPRDQAQNGRQRCV